MAEPAPQYSVGDMVKTFAGAPANPPASNCPTGQMADEDGICQPKKDTRGFSLPTRAGAGAHSATAGSGAAPILHQASLTQSAPAPAVHRDLLITFKLGSAELTDQAKANAKVFAQALGQPELAGAKFEIGGYTDASGTPERNKALSQERAAAVSAYLSSQGIDASRLVTEGYGSDKLIAAPLSPANRRVEARRVG